MLRVRSSILVLALSLAACGDDDPSHVSDAGASGSSGSSGKSGRGGSGGKAGSTAAGSGGASGSAGTGGSGIATQAITIQFKAVVGSDAFACGHTYQHQGTTDATVEPGDFRFYVQDVQLIDDKGKSVPVALAARAPWQTKDLALLDFEDGTAGCSNGNADHNDTVTGTVPVGNYTGISFSNGVPEALNHADPTSLPAPLQAGGLTWGWLYGYKFLKLELNTKDVTATDAGIPGGLLHVGSTGCDNTAAEDGGVDFDQGPSVACTHQNRNLVKLPGYEVGKSVIVADVGAVFKAVDLKASSDCHSDGDACAPLFEAVGLNFSDATVKTTQALYHLE